MVEKLERGEKGFRKLLVWQRAHQLVMLVYKFTGSFPKSELFGLSSQIRRAIVSVPANITEGYAAIGKGQFARFLNSETLRGEIGFLLHQLIQSLEK